MNRLLSPISCNNNQNVVASNLSRLSYEYIRVIYLGCIKVMFRIFLGYIMNISNIILRFIVKFFVKL
jgi:hypothetical protein